MSSLARRVRRLALAGAASIALVGCGTPTLPDDKVPVGVTMDDHFTAMVALRQAVIRGDLFTAKRRAGELDKQLVEDPKHPRHWRRGIAETKKAIGGAVEASELADVARHTASTAAACGGCHERIGVQAFGPVAMHDKKPTTRDEYMRRHRAATENLWIGLLGPSDVAWKVGAKALAGIGSFPGTVGTSQSYRERAEHLERLGKWANEASDRKTRTAVYGQLLGSCASCHELFSGSQ